GIFGRNSRIIGSIPASIKDFPFIVSIRVASSNQFLCAGSIISHWNILTSAQGLYNYNYSDIAIYAGIKSSKNTDGTKFQIANVTFHPKFKELMKLTLIYNYDIAIIKVDKRIEYNLFQRNINLPTKDISTGNLAVIAGWGTTIYPNGNISDELRKSPMIIFHNVHCTFKLQAILNDDQLCAYNEIGVGACTGDSGGPVIHDNKIIGIISLTYGCALGLPDIHTKVYTYLNFIKDIIEN
ncbi:PREDICTED: chymotrypsin-2-like, partial [Ceratosolen solmsi marchali]|uniref:Chymotrypsin-2-like n=1 Tax=Ceratosolen solmsi marchali TaxID=326594 RepID=A0AAJ6YG10_9HYME